MSAPQVNDRTEARGMNERLATLETLVREVLRRLDTDVTARHNDHEERLRALETSSTEQRTKMRTWLAVVGTGATTGGTLLGTLLSHLTGGA